MEEEDLVIETLPCICIAQMKCFLWKICFHLFSKYSQTLYL